MSSCRTLLAAVAACLAVATGAGAGAGSAAASTVTDDVGCWGTLNELAAAAVFADLTDDKLESVYLLLDQLQDFCEAHNFEEATKTQQSIEKLVGK